MNSTSGFRPSLSAPTSLSEKHLRARRSCVRVFALLSIGIASGLSGCDGRTADRTERDVAFASLIDSLSEPNQSFDTDNLITNESSYLHAISTLEAAAISGGAYIGVGPAQNFSYMAQIRPEVAFLVDIRRDNLLQHLMFKALFQVSDCQALFSANATIVALSFRHGLKLQLLNRVSIKPLFL